MANEKQTEEKELLCPFRVFIINGEFATSQEFRYCAREGCAAFYDGMCLRSMEPMLNYLQRRDSKEERP